MNYDLDNATVASIDAGVRGVLQSRKLPRCRKMRFGRAELQKFERRWKFSYYFDAVQDWDAAAGTFVDVDLPEIAPVSFFLPIGNPSNPLEDPAKWLNKAADVVEAHVMSAIFQASAVSAEQVVASRGFGCPDGAILLGG